MAITRDNSYDTYIASASQPFFVTFEYESEEDLSVTVNDIHVDFVLNEGKVEGFSFNEGDIVKIYRDTKPTQTRTFQQEDLSAEELEKALDKLSMKAQDQDRKIGTSLRIAGEQTKKPLIMNRNTVVTVDDLGEFETIPKLDFKGDKGDMPNHEVNPVARQVRFQMPNGEWGQWLDISVSGAITVDSINTGQGANKIYPMDQGVRKTDPTKFASVNTGQGDNKLYPMDQAVLKNSEVDYKKVNCKALSVESLYLKRYKSWIQKGTKMSIPTITKPVITALNQTDVVLYDGTSGELRTYRFDGSIWSIVGTPLYYGQSRYCSLTALNNTDIAIVNNAGGITTYRFDGSNWSQAGIYKSFMPTNIQYPKISALSSTDVAIAYGTSYMPQELVAYHFDGSSWSQVGAVFTLPTIDFMSSIVALNQTDVAVISVINGRSGLQLYRFNGSTWSPLGALCGGTTTAPFMPYDARATAINSTDIVLYSEGGKKLEIYRFDYRLLKWNDIDVTIEITGGGVGDITTFSGSSIAHVDETVKKLGVYEVNFYEELPPNPAFGTL